jgi:hypothetical protein
LIIIFGKNSPNFEYHKIGKKQTVASYLMTSGPNLLDARKCKQSGCFAAITLSRDKYIYMHVVGICVSMEVVR